MKDLVQAWKKDYKKIVFGGIGLYFLVYAIFYVYMKLFIFLTSDLSQEGIDTLKDVYEGDTSSLHVVLNNFGITGAIFGSLATITIFLIIFLVIFDERMMLKGLKNKKEMLFLGFSWAAVFVLADFLISQIYITTKSYPDGTKEIMTFGLSNYANTMFFIPYSYVVTILCIIIMLPVIVMSVKKNRKNNGKRKQK